MFAKNALIKILALVVLVSFHGAIVLADDDQDPSKGGLDDSPPGPDDPDPFPPDWPPIPVPRHAFKHTRSTPPKVVWELDSYENRAQVTRRIAFVIDVSGTMGGNELLKAKEIIVRTLRMFPDDGLFKIYAFSDGVDVFDGDDCKYERATDATPDAPADENGWIRMPNFEAIEKAATWLAEFSGAGNTFIEAGVKRALEDNKEDDLCLLLISDGDATNADAVVFEQITRWSAERSVVVHAVYIGWLKSGNSHGELLMKMIADTTSGSFESWKQSLDDPDDDTPVGPN